MSSAIAKMFAERLKRLRKIHGLSQNELAVRAEVSRAYISRLESMERSPSLEYLQRIADGLNITLIELLNF